MVIELPSGKSTIKGEIPDRTEVAYPHELPGVADQRAEISLAKGLPSQFGQ